MENKEEKTTAIAKKLDSSVLAVITEKQLGGFEKSFQISQAIVALSETLSQEYMKPIMAMQNNRLGFKTDKDNGYPESVVKNCLIEAVLTGVEPYGNQFNIIAGNMYITKEGFGKLLKGIEGLKYDIVFDLPRINPDKTSAAVTAKITWSLSSSEQQIKEIPIPVRMNAHMGVDAVIGKATRKARAWLFNTVTGYEVADGDVSDVSVTVIDSKITGPSLEELQNLYDEKLPELNKQEMQDIERIITNKEAASYKKAFDLLKAK